MNKNTKAVGLGAAVLTSAVIAFGAVGGSRADRIVPTAPSVQETSVVRADMFEDETQYTEYTVIADISDDFVSKTEPPESESSVKKTATEKKKETEKTAEASENEVLYFDLNTATAEELMKISGIGESTADKIIEYRKANSGFRKVSELIEVKGIGEKKLEAIRPYVYVTGESTAEVTEAVTSVTTEIITVSVTVSESVTQSEAVIVTAAASENVSADSIGKININTASAEELQSLNGIGEVISQRIVEYRTKNGAFTSVDELVNVKGIGEKKLEAIRDDITV